MRTLYAPIFEAGTFHDAAVRQKRGLYNALAAQGAVHEWDYLANDASTRYQGLINRIEQFEPTHILTQFHGADVILPQQIDGLRNRYPGIVWMNWSGDSWAWSLTSPAMLELAKRYDLWLVCAPDALPTYAEHGIHARFWQIAYEPPPTPLPDMPTYDVVFMGNIISEPRRKLLERLRGLDGVSVGIYGDWEHADGHNTYHFDEGEALYRNATLSVADCAYPDQRNYISNRPFHIAAAGGALLLHQRVERMDILSGMVAGEHYIEWLTLDDLPNVIRDWLRPERADDRARIVKAAREFVLRCHTWDRRVEQVIGWLAELEQVKT